MSAGGIAPGKIVALTGIRAWPQDETGQAGPDLPTSGLFELVMHFPYEPSNYVHEACWLISRVPDNPTETGDDYIVSDYDLWEQVEPDSFARHIFDERMLELAEA